MKDAYEKAICVAIVSHWSHRVLYGFREIEYHRDTVLQKTHRVDLEPYYVVMLFIYQYPLHKPDVLFLSIDSIRLLLVVGKGIC